MIQIMHNGDLDPQIRNDPRMSASQLASMRKIARSDPRAAVVGLDQKMRPVIECVSSHGELVLYSLLRNGDPAKVRMPYVEEWGLT